MARDVLDERRGGAKLKRNMKHVPKKQAQTWQKLLSREGVDVTTISQIDVVFYDLLWRTTKERKEVLFTVLRQQNFTHYIAVDPQGVGRYAYRTYFKSPKQITKYYADGRSLLKKIKKDSTRWSRILSQRSTDHERLSAFKQFRQNFEKISYIYSITSWLGIEAWQIDFETILDGLIKKQHQEKETEAILATVYKPWKKTALMEIQAKLAKGRSAKQIAKEYQFLRSWSVVWYKPIAEAWVESIKHPSQKEAVKSYSLEKVIALLKPNKEEEAFLHIAPYVVFFKDWRDDVRRFQAYAWSFLFDVLAQAFGVERDDLGYLTLDEIEKAIKTGVFDAKMVERRKRGCIVTIAEKGLATRVLDEQMPKKYEEIVREIEARGEAKVVHGKIAQMGVVQGLVRVMRSHHDIKRAQEGDILVANTTHPSYLPAMQKAAAFVTNEGGLISHTAIVAREMKKPCIVGTKNATKVLMDGDLVEVDANKGVVRLLKRKNA